MSKRVDIITSMSARLNEIVSGSEHISGSAARYQTTLSGSVGVWRVIPLTEDELPYVNIRDTEDTIRDLTQDGTRREQTQHSLTVELELIAGDMATVRKCIEDIELAISKDETWGGLALRTQPINNTVIASQERDIVGGALITVRVDYRTTKFRGT